MKNKAFTLIELLVVVLIIGILAAIAVPQYQVAVGKSKFSTIKNMAKTIGEACEVYDLANGHYPTEYSDMDITLPGISWAGSNANTITIVFTNGNVCNIWHNGGDRVQCRTIINNVEIAYYVYPKINRQECYAFSTNQSDVANKVCKQDTGDNGWLVQNSYYSYKY